MSKSKKCQAKNPETCPYHGALLRQDKALSKLEAGFDGDALEDYFQARKDIEAEANRKQTKAKERILAELNEVIEEEFLPMATIDHGYIDTRHLVRGTNQMVRYILVEYRKAYGDGYDFEIAKQKLSTVYHLSRQGGYRHGKVIGDKYMKGETFYPVFQEAIVMLQDTSITEKDVATFRAKAGLCKYGFGHIEYNKGDCDNRCKSNVGKQVTYDLPNPIY